MSVRKLKEAIESLNPGANTDSAGDALSLPINGSATEGKRGVKRAILLFVAVVLVAVNTWTRFAHPELTETQLLLTFWPIYITTLCVAWLSKQILE